MKSWIHELVPKSPGPKFTRLNVSQNITGIGRLTVFINSLHEKKFKPLAHRQILLARCTMYSLLGKFY